MLSKRIGGGLVWIRNNIRAGKNIICDKSFVIKIDSMFGIGDF